MEIIIKGVLEGPKISRIRIMFKARQKFVKSSKSLGYIAIQPHYAVVRNTTLIE